MLLIEKRSLQTNEPAEEDVDEEHDGKEDPKGDRKVGKPGGVGPQAPGNTVGSLQELCVKHGYPMPTYDLGAVGGQPHMRNFTIMCCVGKMRESGTGGSKKDAKREAAQKMIDKLKCLGPNNSQAPVVDVTQPEMDEEMLAKLSNLKVETLNSAASQKVAGFYRKLQTAGGNKLASLHMTSLKTKTADYVAMLGELGKEQKFEVTYVEVEEKCDDDSTQCLVQLSTLPVAVSKNLLNMYEIYT